MAGNSRDEILRFVLETQGQEGLDALAKSFANAGKEGEQSSEEIKKLAAELAALLDRTRQVDALAGLQEQLGKIDAQLGSAKDRLALLNATYGETGPRTASVTKEFQDAEQAVANLSNRQDQLAVRVATASAALSTAGVDTSNLSKAHEELAAKATSTAEHLAIAAVAAERGGISFATFKEHALQVGESLRSGGERALEFGKHLLEISGIAGVVAGALATITGFRFFEAGVEDAQALAGALRKLSAVSGATGEDLNHLKELAEEAAHATSTSTVESVQALTQLTKSFGDVNKAAEVLPATLQFAKASGLELSQAVDIVATTMKAFNISADQASHVTDALATVSRKTGADLGALSDSFGKLAPYAAQAHISFDETAAALGALSQRGLNAEQSSRALIAVFNALDQPGSKLRQQLVGLGIDTSSFAKILDGLKAAGDRGVEALEGLDKRARPAVLALVQAGSAGLRDLTTAIGQSAGETQRLSDLMTSGFGTAVKNFKTHLDEIAGESVSGVFAPLNEEIRKLDSELLNVSKTTAFEKIKETIKDFVSSSVTALDEFLHSVDWPGLGKTISDFVSSAKTSFTDFIANFRTVGNVVGGIGNTIALTFNGLYTVLAGFSTAVVTAAAYGVKAYEVLRQTQGAIKPELDAIERVYENLAQTANELGEKTAAGFNRAAQNVSSLAANIDNAGAAASDAKPKHDAHAASIEASGSKAEQARAIFDKLPPAIQAQIKPFLDAAEASEKAGKGAERAAEGTKELSSSIETAAQKLANSQKALVDAANDFDRLRATVGTTNEQLAAARQRVVDAQLAYEAMEKETGGLAAQNRNLTASVYENEAAFQKAKDAAVLLGFTLQDDLAKKASSAKNAFDEIDKSAAQTAAGLADRQNAFLAYAQDALAASKNLSQGAQDSVKYQLESKAGALDLSDGLKKLEQSQVGVSDTAQDAAANLQKQGTAATGAAGATQQHAEATKQSRDAMEDAAGIAGKLAEAMEGTRKEFLAVSEAAAHAFDDALQGALKMQGILPQIGQGAKDVYSDLERLHQAAESDVVGIDKYYYALALAQKETTEKINEQRAALDAQTSAYQNVATSGSNSLKQLEVQAGGNLETLKAIDKQLQDGTYNAGLLGKQDLAPFQAAIQAAIGKVEALTNAEKAATQQLADLNAQLQDQIDQKNNDQSAIENRSYEKQKQNIEDLAKQADASGKAQADQALQRLEQIHQRALKDIADQAAAQKQANQQTQQTASNAGGSGGTSASQSNSGAGGNVSINLGGINLGGSQLSETQIGQIMQRLQSELLPMILQQLRQWRGTS